MVATVGKCYTNPKDYAQDNYYTEGEGLAHSEWMGKAAAAQGLKGQVQEKDFHNAYQSRDPQGHPLRRLQQYREESRRRHRPGTDITLSAPKSLSVAALVFNNPQLRAAHQAAVRATMGYVETHCIFYQTKQRGQKLTLPSQTAQIAVFHHDDNRNKDPQLHSHCVILNQTLCPDQKWRAVANEQLYRQQKTIGAYYHHELARQLHQHGYRLEWTDDYSFELAGIDKAKLDSVFSTRSQQIEAVLAGLGLTRSTASAEQKQTACLLTRRQKKHYHTPEDRQQLQEIWHQKAKEVGLEFQQRPMQQPNRGAAKPRGSQAEEIPGFGFTPAPLHFGIPTSHLPHTPAQKTASTSSPVENLSELVRSATELLTERQTAFQQHELLRECLRQSQGRYEPKQIEAEITSFPELVPTRDGRWTTTTQLRREQRILQLAQASRNACPPLASCDQAKAIASARGLNGGQTTALMHLSMSQDGVLLVQGNAGVGKTYTMKAFKAAIGNQPIRGLAPSAAAADVLQTESGIPSQTLASYLLTSDERLPRPEILLVDEAGMLSSAQMEGLLEKAHKHHNRVLLVGDTKQLAAVEAGAPFKLLQTAGLPTALIDQNLRQRDPHLKQVVDLMATHEQNADSINRAYQHLDKQGKIRQIVAESERLQVLAADYLSRPEEVRAKTLILASTNADKSAIATTVRQGLIAQGILGDESLQIQTLKGKALDPFALTQAHSYQRGDVIKFQTNSARFSQDLYYRISAVKPHTQTATLIDTAGQTHELPLNRYKQREVYRVQNLEIRPGEQMRFTKNLRTSNQKQLNGQRFTVEGFTLDGQITIQTGGKVQEVCPFQLLHSDYGYVDTVHSSQGRTADYCIYSAAPVKSLTIGRESFYVAASRARQEFVVYTASTHDLGVTVKQSRANENALDLVEAEQRKLPTKSPMSSQSVQKARDCPPAGQEPINSLSSAPLPHYSSASATPSLPSDAELLAQLQAVQQWQKRCPPSPQPSEGEKLKRKLNDLTRRKTKLEQLEREQAIELERLGKPRSWFNPFGPSAERVEEQQEQLRDTRANLYPVARELASVKVRYQQWQQKVRDYQAWQRAPQTQKMKELIEFLKSPPVQERFQLLQQVDEVHSAAQYILDWQGEQGKDCRYFQGKFYRIEERGGTLTISHQERTEVILEVADRRGAGGILEIGQFNLSETDREKLRAYAQALEQQVQRWQEGQSRESQELELGG